MKFARIFAFLFAFGVLAVFALLVFWFFLGGRDQVRSEIVSNLRPVFGETFDLADISIYPHSVVLHDVILDPSSTLHLNLKAVTIRLSFYSFLQGGGDWQGTIGEIELLQPRFSIITTDTIDSISNGYNYQPFALKKLSALKVIRRIRTIDGSIISDKFDRLLVENINGQVDLVDPTHSILNVTAVLPLLDHAGIKIDGRGDVTTGEFFASLRVDLPKLEGLRTKNSIDKLNITGGDLSLDISVWGGADVRFNGEIVGDSIAANFDQKVFFKDGKISGNIFGQVVDVSGSILVNDNPVEFKVESTDIFRTVWSASLSSVVDISTIEEAFEGTTELEGEIEVKGELGGRGPEWWSDLTLNAEKVKISNFLMENPHCVLKINNGRFRVDQFTANIGNGMVKLSGEFDPISGDLDLDGEIEQSWDREETPDWCQILAPKMSATFGLTRKEGIWFGGGVGGIYDVAGNNHAQINLSLVRNQFQLGFQPTEGKRGFLGLNYSPQDKIPLRLIGRDPQLLLQEIVKEKYLPDMILEYGVRIEAAGTLQDISGTIVADGGVPSRGITANFTLSKETNGWEGDLKATLKLPNRHRLQGEARIAVNERRFDLAEGIFSDERGNKLLDVQGGYSFVNHQIDKFSLGCEDLPLVEILKLGFDKFQTGVGANVDLTVELTGEGYFWNGHSELIFPDSVIYDFDAEGRLESSSLSMSKAILTSQIGDSVLFSALGSYDFSRKSLDSVVISLNQFSIERLLEVIAPSWRGKFAGIVNARLEFSGELTAPDLSTDFHLTSGVLFGKPGYWANVKASGEGGVYELVELNLGHEISALLSGSGHFDSNTKQYKLSAKGNQVEIGGLINAISPIKLPISGNSDIKIELDGSDKFRQARASVMMKSGRLGTIEFRGLMGQLSLSGLNEYKPVLHFDSLVVDWGDVKGTVIGELPLTLGRSIEMKFVLDGRLISFLPQITPSFSNPLGRGRLELSLGGDLKKPRFVEGKFLMNNGGFDLKNVIREVRKIEADILLDSRGEIRINRFDFDIDDAHVSISNRQANAQAVEEPIIVYGYNFGILQVQTVPDGFWIVIPGLMEKSWGGYLALSGLNQYGAFEFMGPAERPRAVGQANFRNAIFTYPPIRGQGAINNFTSALLQLLRRIRWDGRLTTDHGCRYVREISGLGELKAWEQLKNQLGGGLLNPDLMILVDLRLDDNPLGLVFNGSFADTLRLSGEFTSTQGSVEFLDLDFQVEKIGIEFNPALMDPVLYGTAATTVLDSSDIARLVRIRVHSGDEGSAAYSNENQQRARFSDLTLTFEDDQGHSQEQVLALLGYSPQQLPGKLSGLGGQLFESATPLKKWQRGFERILEQWTGLDRISVRTSVTQNLIEKQINPVTNVNQPGSASNWNLLYGSRVTLGKYVLPNLYLAYTGALITQAETYSQSRLGIQHSWDLSFRLTSISNNLVLNNRFEYNELARSSINSVLIRYDWMFDSRTLFRKVWK